MTKLKMSMLAFAAVFGTTVAATSAHAQATRTWVSGVGDDVNPCSRTAPCKTFAGAISKTAASGEINCIDPGGFGAVTITKSITIDCLNTEAGVLVAGTNGITINDSATATPGQAVVVLRGLDIFGTSGALNGVNFVTGAAVSVEKCVIRQFNGAAPNGFGIRAINTTAGRLYVSDTVLTGNGAAPGGGGIQIKPSGSGGTKYQIVNIRAHNNTNGVIVDGSGGTGAVRGSIDDSAISSSTGEGVFVSSGGTTATVQINRSSITGSGGNGVNSAGAGATALINANAITANNVGLTFSGGGTLLTYNNNGVNLNVTSDGAASAAPLGFK